LRSARPRGRLVTVEVEEDSVVVAVDEAGATSAVQVAVAV
jgi:hypothetical protein